MDIPSKIKNPLFSRFFFFFLNLIGSALHFFSNFFGLFIGQIGVLKVKSDFRKIHIFTFILLNLSIFFLFNQASAHTFTANGQAKLGTEQFKFGTASGDFTDNSSNNDYISAPDSGDFAFGTGDFTIAGWVYINANGSNGYILSQGQSDTSFSVGTYGGGTNPGCYLAFATSNAGWTYADFPGGTFTQNAWHFCALVRSGTTFYGYEDTARFTLATGNSTAMDDSAASVVAGDQPAAAPFMGYLDEVIVVKGQALYTADPITLETSEYCGPDYTTTVLLLHFNGADDSTTFTDSASDTSCQAAAGTKPQIMNPIIIDTGE